MIQGFNVRVYGILLSSSQKEVLLVDEVIMGKRLVKFPGGGVEHIEGPGLALEREFKEELDLDIKVGKIFYVSPHFHRSFFREQQLIGIYWKVDGYDGSPVKSRLHNLKVYWQNIENWDVNALTHEMDREVAAILKADCRRI